MPVFFDLSWGAQYAKHHFQHARCMESKVELGSRLLVEGGDVFVANDVQLPSVSPFPASLRRPQGVGDFTRDEMFLAMYSVLMVIEGGGETPVSVRELVIAHLQSVFRCLPDSHKNPLPRPRDRERRVYVACLPTDLLTY